MYKIILVSSGQPSLNPRLVKEANALADAGYNVTVFYAYWNDWATQHDKQLLAYSRWKAVRVGGSPQQQKFSYLISRIMHKIGRSVNHRLFAEWGLSRATYHLIKEVKKHKGDLYIAHNLGALPAACQAAKKYNKPVGFDAEDFHRNEVSDDPSDKEVKRKIKIENQYFRQLSYLTTSSPHIAQKYKVLFPSLNPTVILNVFDKSTVNVSAVGKPIKLFWFSQTIGPGRGLEDVAKALSALNKENYELHLLGNMPVLSLPFIKSLKGTGVNLVFHPPIPSDQIVPFAAQFDIGLALEQQTPLNRDICLTNKLFTYMQAGLAIIASNTTAQTAFMQKHSSTGSTFKSGNLNDLTQLLETYQQNPDKVMDCKKASLHLAQNVYNWENESQKFSTLVASAI